VTDIIRTTRPAATPQTRWIQKIVERTMQRASDQGAASVPNAPRYCKSFAFRFVARRARKKGRTVAGSAPESTRNRR